MIVSPTAHFYTAALRKDQDSLSQKAHLSPVHTVMYSTIRPSSIVKRRRRTKKVAKESPLADFGNFDVVAFHQAAVAGINRFNLGYSIGQSCKS